MQELAGISDAELGAYVTPAGYERPEAPVPQVAYDDAVLKLTYPESVYRRMLSTSDEAFWNAVVSEPPVKVEPANA